MRANRAESVREILFRRALWREGVRGYRVHPRLPGRPDLTFPSLRLAVFVNGCFWHQCPVCALAEPKANLDFWREKLSANVRRDQEVLARLDILGWVALTIWEHEIRPDPNPRARAFAIELKKLRGSRRCARPRS
jgi:DNA mismatch endonuclease, patch repair protein